jgi:UDP-N-acetylglucosamine--N-acetylmuramyl-(pentapeptide) pyrophosphoryl-undecaprenol N-acetylglucosamine transferase
VIPSLAIAEALRARGVRVTFAGSPDRIEARLVPEAGYEFDPFRITGLPRRPSVAQARSVLLAGRAPAACLRILARRRPDVVLGGGGYVAGPMVLAAALRGIPAALTEADAHLGLANRLAAPFARRVFLAYPVAGRRGRRYRVTGRPIPARSRDTVSQAEARARFGLPEQGAALLVFGGSQGARRLNELAVDTWGDAGPPLLHLCGERDYEALAARIAREDYRLVAFTHDFGAALAACDLAIARAGGSVWELAASGLPAILVPYPYATADHQTKNALWFASAGGAELVPEAELGRVPSLVAELLADADRLRAMGEAMRGRAMPRAADDIADELVALARARHARG